MADSKQRELVRSLSAELVELQRPIRILDAIAWGDDVAAQFFAHGATRQPEVDAEYYRRQRPLRFDPTELRTALDDLDTRIGSGLGGSTAADLMRTRVGDYRRVVDLLAARGTPEFSQVASELYGGADDEVHAGGPTLASLGELMHEALANIDSGRWEPPEEERYSAEEGVGILAERLTGLCGAGQIRIVIDDGIVADAAAGSDYIKLRADAHFSDRDLRVLEVHEGWVHVATTINGRRQEWCPFLSKGTPATTVTQEGLAVFTEVTTLSSTPDRLRKITRRMRGIHMAQDGATFLDVYRWLLADGVDEAAAWSSAVRVFRGSTPTDGPFTKDLVYSRGFLEVYDVMRLAVRRGLLERLPLLFVGKIAVRELGAVAELVDDGLVDPPAILPPNVSDVTALASWLAFSNLLNRIDLDTMAVHLAAALD